MFNPVQNFVDSTNSWQQSMRDSNNARNTQKILDDAKNMYKTGLELDNGNIKNKYMSGSNLNNLAGAILTYADSKGKYDEYASLQPSQIVDLFMQKNKGRGYEQYINMYTGGKMSFDEVTKKIGINQNYIDPYYLSEDADDGEFDPTVLSDYNEEDWEYSVPTNSGNAKAKKWGVLATGIGAGGLAATYGIPSGMYWGGKGLGWAGRQMFDTTVSTTDKEASLLSDELGNEYGLQDEIKDAKKALKRAKKAGEGVQEAEEALTQAKENLNNFKTKEKGKVVETRKTIFEPLGSDLTRGWTAEQRAAIAKKESNKIYKDIINPLLEKSQKTINLNEIFDEMAEDISKVTYKERREALQNAFEDFKTKVSDKTDLTLKEADALKKDLWKEVPKKYFNKDGRDVSSERRQLEGDLGTKLKNRFHSLLKEEFGVDSAQKYLDYHNWVEYKKSQDKLAKDPVWKGSINETLGKMSEGGLQKGGYYLNRVGEKLTNASKKAYETIVEGTYNSAKKLLSSIKKDPKVLVETIKKGGKGLLDPVALIMPDFSPEGVEGYKNSEIGQKTERWFNDWINKNFGQDITKEEWIGLIGEDGYANLEGDSFKSLKDKGWTEEGIITLLNSLE